MMMTMSTMMMPTLMRLDENQFGQLRRENGDEYVDERKEAAVPTKMMMMMMIKSTQAESLSVALELD